MIKKSAYLLILIITCLLTTNALATSIQSTVIVKVNEVSTLADSYWDIGDSIVITFTYNDTSIERNEYTDGVDGVADFFGQNDDVLNNNFTIADGFGYDLYADAAYVFDTKMQQFLSNSVDVTNLNWSWYNEKSNDFWLYYAGDGARMGVHQKPTGTQWGRMYLWDGAEDQYVKFDVENITYSPDSPVPEPATIMLFGVGLLSLAGVSRIRK